MKFGLDFNSDVLPRSPVANLDPSSALFDVYKSRPATPRTEKALAIELLNNTLSRMNRLLILRAQDSSAERRRRIELLFQKGRSQNDYIGQLVEQKSALDRKLKKREVQQIIEHQEKLRREEEARRKALQEEKERKEREELERKKKQEEEAKRKEEEAAKPAGGFTVPEEVEKEVLKFRQDILDIKKNIVEEMNKNRELKKNAGVVKRKLNIKFGQLSSSMTQLNTITREVVELVNYTKQNELVYQWILNFIAKAIVAQAETEVIVQPTAALPLARLALHLLQNLDGLYYYLCARFAKKCALILGYTCAIDTEEGRTRMGWRRTDEKWEAEVKYEERMGGIAAVWAVMARLGADQKSFPFFSMASEWKLMARMLNTSKDLITNVHYVVFCNWWEAAAEYLVKNYGKQAIKGLQLAVGDWVSYGKLKSYPAATRLSILGEDYATQGNFNLLKEMDN